LGPAVGLEAESQRVAALIGEIQKRAEQIVDRVSHLEELPAVRQLTQLLQAGEPV